MKLVIQRVSRASVACGAHFKAIGRGLLVLFGAEEGDRTADAVLLARKTAGLRIFPDENGKMNLSLADIGGEVLVVPNFSLAADCRKGNRPSFIKAGDPAAAAGYFEEYLQLLAGYGLPVKGGVFGGDMQVELVNDGPITIIMDTTEWKQ